VLLASTVKSHVKFMIKRIFNKIEQYILSRKKFYLHRYLKSDGSFDYASYKKIQVEGNKRKINSSWIREGDIDFLSEYIASKIDNVEFGICHGTRRGLEQMWFSKKLNCHVLGTEISDSAKNYENTIEWDFHEENKDWLGKANFVYSNSFDHAYSPEKALTAWMQTLKPQGVCIIEHTIVHEAKHSSALDPFGASLDIMPYLILQWGKGKYSVREILIKQTVEENECKRRYLVVMNN